MAHIPSGPAGRKRSHPEAQAIRLTHTRARPLGGIDLGQPGRLRVGHLLTLFSVSHSTLYSHIKAGKIPKPDGEDGARPFWLTSTVAKVLGAEPHQSI